MKGGGNMRVKAKTLSGFMELSPEKQIIFNDMKDKIISVFKLNGLSPMDTPILEYSDVLLAKAGGETEKQIYRFKKGDADICMRFDLTVPFAKYVSLFQNTITFPFRRFQIGKVFRGERAQKGRLREFYQCDMDIIDESDNSKTENLFLNSLHADAECIDVLSQVFNALNLSITIKISNRKILTGVLDHLGLTDKTIEIFTLLDKKNKIEREQFLSQLNNLTSFSEIILKVLDCKSIFDLSKLKIDNSTYKQGIEEIRTLFEILDMKNLKNQIVFDLSIIRGLDYYTGTVFETFLNQMPEKISVAGGGRYDNLADCFTNRKFSGVGLSVGLSRLFDLLDKSNMLIFSKTTYTQIAIIPLFNKINESETTKNHVSKDNISKEISKNDIPENDILKYNISENNIVKHDTLKNNDKKMFDNLKIENIINHEILKYCFELSRTLISEHVCSEILYSNKSFKSKLNYANKKQIPYIIVVGENEIKNKKYSFKNMKSGEEFLCDKNELLKHLRTLN